MDVLEISINFLRDWGKHFVRITNLFHRLRHTGPMMSILTVYIQLNLPLNPPLMISKIISLTHILSS